MANINYYAGINMVGSDIGFNKNEAVAIVIDNQNENFTREIKEIDKSQLKDGNVLVKVDYSSLNYKDALILNDGGKIVRKFPFVPGIDFSGTVVELSLIHI